MLWLHLISTTGSAGGLSTFLHTDRIRNRLLKAATPPKRITAAPVVGYFLDHANYAHDAANYTNKMKWIYHMQVCDQTRFQTLIFDVTLYY